MIPGRPRCSLEARTRGEPLYATASLVTAWLLIEQPGAWGPDALFDSRLPRRVAGQLNRSAVENGVRILLIRRTRSDPGDRTVLLAHSGGERVRPNLVAAVFDDPSSLLDLDLEALAAGRTSGLGDPVEGNVYLVCTHGRHDICCADNGRPLYRMLAEAHPELVWESSHIGGDRFAGNLVVLPRGDYFGRIAPDDAGGLVASYEEGLLDLDRYRGKSTRRRMVQAAEHFLRVNESRRGVDDLEVIDDRRPRLGHADVTFRAGDGSDHLVRVRARRVPPPVYLTCRAEAPGFQVTYDLLSIDRV